MKKLLLAATLFAGTTLGFAKNQIQNRLLQNTISTSSETFSKEMKALHFTSFTEALAFMEECKDVVVAEQEVEVENENGEGTHKETRIISSCETTYPCEKAGVTLYLIKVK